MTIHGLLRAPVVCVGATILSIFSTLIIASPVRADEPKKEKKHAPAGNDLAARTKEILRTHCVECHGPKKAQAGVRVLDYNVLVKEKEKVIPGKPDESVLYQLITADDGSNMPPEGQPRLSEDEVATIRKWIVAGAPPFPDDAVAPTEENRDTALQNVVGVDYVLKSILEYLRKQPAEKQPFVRFFSTNHLLTGGATRDELDLHREALAKALNHLSRERMIVKPDPIEATATVFAIDLRTIGWHRQPFEMTSGTTTTRSKLNVFDLVLLEYPYGIIYEDSETFEELAKSYLLPAGLVRPIPYVRADWFASHATQPPLYEDLLQLPFELSELETRLEVDSKVNIRDGVAKRAGMTVSGVSRNNRVVERHVSSNGAYWKSFDFSTNKGRENMFQDPVNLHPAGGEMVFSLPNGLNGYFVTDSVGRRIDAAPTSIVTDKFAADKTVRNGLSCMRCHDQGIKGFADNVRPAVEKLPGSPGFDKKQTMRLYAPVKAMDELLKEDTQRFMTAMQSVLGKSQMREPLIGVTQRFLDAPLQLTSVSSELGLPSTDGLQPVFRAPHFSVLGLVPLASHGVVRRDMWEDYYDQVVRALGLGVPIVALDGLTRSDFPVAGSTINVEIGTNHSTNVFAPGDDMVVFLTNRSNTDVQVELVATSARRKKVILLPSSTVLKSGEQHRFPKTGSIKIQSGIGKEQLTVFASEQEFPAGVVLKGKDTTDRVLHQFYTLKQEDGRINSGFDPAKMIKKTIEIETR